MRINQTTSGYTDPASRGKRTEALEAVLARRGQAADSTSAGAPTGSDSLKQTLAAYDMKNITPAEFSEMIQKLAKSGVISESELKDLSAVRVDLEAAGVDTNQKVNLVDFYAEKTRKASQQMADDEPSEAQKQQLMPLMQRREWVEKFALIQANPESLGLNTVA